MPIGVQGGGELVDLDNLHILHVSTWKLPCGIATYCENLVRSLEGFGVKNSIAPLYPSEWKYCVKEDVSAWRQSILESARDVDLVHIQHEHGFFGYDIGSRFAVRRFGELLTGLKAMDKPVVTTFHTDICTHRRRGWRGRWDKFRRAQRWGKYVTHHFGGEPNQAKAVVHSQATRHSFVHHGFPVSSVHVVPHPCLPPMQHAISSADAKRSLGYPANSVVLSIFGFIGNYKGHDLAIESLASLPENYHLAIVGGMHPESKDAFLDKLLSTMPESIAHRVYITGWVDRETADRYFAATDVCLAPYRGDTMLSGSGAITWGLSSGRPVVASKIEAFQNLDRVGNCLFLVTPEKTAELTSAIQKVVSDPTLRDRLVTNATRFCEMNSWSNSVGKIARVYETTLLGNAARSGLNNYPMFAVA